MRLRIGPGVDFKGPKSFRPLSFGYENCFIYVTEINRLDSLEKVLRLYNRDFDILDDNLGKRTRNLINKIDLSNLWNDFSHTLDEISSQFALDSNHYVTERLVRKIDGLTSLMIENGLNEYFASMDAFKRNFHDMKYSRVKDEEFKELTIDQLKRPMILMVGLLIFATVIFIIQIIVSKLKSFKP